MVKDVWRFSAVNKLSGQQCLPKNQGAFFVKNSRRISLKSFGDRLYRLLYSKSLEIGSNHRTMLKQLLVFQKVHSAFLFNRLVESKHIRYDRVCENIDGRLHVIQMDKIDCKILTILEQNARLPIKQIAQMVYMSSPAVSARIDSLEKRGIITGYMATVDHVKIGYHVTAFINLEMSPKKKTVFYPFISQCPNVMECHCVTGQYSMLIKVAFKSTVELDVFINQLQKFGNTSTQIVFSTSVNCRGVNLMANEEES